MLWWRIGHQLRLWLVIRVMAIIVSVLYALWSGLPPAIPVGVETSIAIAALLVAADLLDEQRFSLGVVYANLGYSSLFMRSLAAFCAVTAEVLFSLVMRVAT